MSYTEIDVAEKYRKVGALVELWGVHAFDNRKLPLYWEARRSSRPQIFANVRKRYAKVEKQFPQNLERSVTSRFTHHNEHALSENIDAINDAAKRDDADFFISLGKVLSKRKKRTLLTMDALPSTTTDADLLLQLWTTGLLWLMSDNAVLQFFLNVIGVRMGLQAFQKTRTRLHLTKLKPPVIRKVARSRFAIADPNTVSAFYEGQHYTLYFARGWSLAQAISGEKPM